MSNYLITGCSSGLGAAITRELVGRGHRVWGVARRRQKLVEAAEILGDRFRFSVCDVGRRSDVLYAKREMDEAGFLPDVIVLNAAINPEKCNGPFLLEEFSEVLRVNLLGAMVWVELFLPEFESTGSGQFAAISSLAAYRGDARWIAYGASKAALGRAFEGLRGRFAHTGVHFTTIHLGGVKTGMGFRSGSPFKLSEDRAVRYILSAIERRRCSVTIPRYQRIVMEATRVLPDSLYSRVVTGVVANPESSRENVTASPPSKS